MLKNNLKELESRSGKIQTSVRIRSSLILKRVLMNKTKSHSSTKFYIIKKEKSFTSKDILINCGKEAIVAMLEVKRGTISKNK